MQIETTPEMVKEVYAKLKMQSTVYKKTVKRPLTLTEKILAGHLDEKFLDKILDEKTNYVFLKPDRVGFRSSYLKVAE